MSNVHLKTTLTTYVSPGRSEINDQLTALKQTFGNVKKKLKGYFWIKQDKTANIFLFICVFLGCVFKLNPERFFVEVT